MTRVMTDSEKIDAIFGEIIPWDGKRREAKMIFGQFSRGYLINLPERVDRRRQAQRELDRAGLTDVSIVPACKFTSPDAILDGPSGFKSTGARGCFYSHLKCLKELARSGETGLILEDDICIARSINVLDINQALKDWDIVYFGHELTGDIPRANSSTRDVIFEPYSGKILTLHFYGVHQRIVKRLVEFLEMLLTRSPGDLKGGPMPIDGAISTFRELNPDVRTLIAVPKLGWQRASRSDLSPRKIDGLQILRPFLAAARGLKNTLT